MPGTSLRRRIVNVLPLPGVDEIENAVKGLIDGMKAAGYESNQCESLVRRIDGLIAVANACDGIDDYAEILSQLQDVKSRFESKFNSKSKLSAMLRAQDRQQAYEDINRELSDLMEKAQLQLSASNRRILIEDMAQLNKTWMEEIARVNKTLMENKTQPNGSSIEYNFDTIRKHNISFDDTESPTWTSSAEIHSGQLIRRSNQVAIHCRHGRLGKLRVAYTSFSSRSDHIAATERAEEELKHLSRIQHPNIAEVVGVTRSCDGMNGLVLAMDGIPGHKFVQTSAPGVVLARFFKGLVQVVHFMAKRKSSGDDDISLGAATVAPNGHVTALVLRDESRHDSGDYDGSPDPLMMMVLDIFKDKMHSVDSEDDLQAETMGFMESLANLGQSHLTELRILKIRADCGFRPDPSKHSWYGASVPSFTVYPGDLGSVDGTGWRNNTWKVLEVFSGTNTESNISDSIYRVHNCSWRSLPSTHPQYRTWASDCHCDSAQISFKYPKNEKGWKEGVERAQTVSEQQNLELDVIQYVVSMSFEIRAERYRLSNQPMTQGSLYFHRNPLARSSPRDFWGFFSASPDPCAPSTGLEALGWTCRYIVDYKTMCIGESWERKYQRALQAGLETMPGAYPGAYVEELFDDETE